MAKKPKQKFIGDTEPERIEAIEDQAEKYRAARDHRMSMTEDEVDERNKLLALMKEHKLTEYKTAHGQRVLVETDEKVKVKSVENNGKGDDE